MGRHLDPARCRHDFRPIGETTHTGPTWMQVSRVAHCRACGEIAICRPHRYADYPPRGTAEVVALRAAERAALETLLADFRADPAATVARYAAAEAERRALVDAAIARAGEAAVAR